MIHQPLPPDGVHPQISSSEVVSPLPCSYGLVRQKSLVNLTNATPAFSTL